MTTAADKIKANAERLRAKTDQPAQAAAGTTAAVRQKNVRRTVDLSPGAHRGLDAWQSATAERLGLARVTGQEVLRALVDQLLADDALAEQITATIAQDRPTA